MTTLNEICDFLETEAPTNLAEDWDNVGLLAGDKSADVFRIMTCLTITPESAAEAIEHNANLIVTHHPLPFRAIKKLTTETTPTKLLWDLIRNSVAIYSPHTGFDSAQRGINQMICDRIGIAHTTPIAPFDQDVTQLGGGRIGRLNEPLELTSFIEFLKQKFAMKQLRYVGKSDQTVSVVASACGSGGIFLEQAARAGCDAFVTGEANFHTCLAAKAGNIALVLLGHYDSERFAIEVLSDRLQQQFTGIEIWPSQQESDPVNWA